MSSKSSMSMSMSMSSDTVGVEILNLFGIPVENCRKATISLETGEPVIVVAEYYGAGVRDELGHLCTLDTVLRRFELVEKVFDERLGNGG